MVNENLSHAFFYVGKLPEMIYKALACRLDDIINDVM